MHFIVNVLERQPASFGASCTRPKASKRTMVRSALWRVTFSIGGNGGGAVRELGSLSLSGGSSLFSMIGDSTGS